MHLYCFLDCGLRHGDDDVAFRSIDR